MNTTALTITNTTVDTRASFNSDLYKSWIEYIDATPKTAQTYTKAIKPFFNFLQVNNITAPCREDIKAYRSSIENLKPTTRQLYMTVCKSLFNWLESENLYSNVAKGIKSGVKIDKVHKKDSLTSRQAGMLYSGIQGNSLTDLRDKAMVSLMLTTGLRTASIKDANIEDLRNVNDAPVLYYVGKEHSEKAVYVKLTAHTEEAIRAYLTARNEKDEKAPLFISTGNHNNAGRMQTESISRIIKTRMRNVGINSSRLSAHSLRHTAGNLALRNGATLEEVQQLLNHKNIATTMVYIDELRREDNNSSSIIDKAIFG